MSKPTAKINPKIVAPDPVQSHNNSIMDKIKAHKAGASDAKKKHKQGLRDTNSSHRTGASDAKKKHKQGLADTKELHETGKLKAETPSTAASDNATAENAAENATESIRILWDLLKELQAKVDAIEIPENLTLEISTERDDKITRKGPADATTTGWVPYYFSAIKYSDTVVNVTGIRYRYEGNTGDYTLIAGAISASRGTKAVTIPIIDGEYYIYFEASYSTATAGWTFDIAVSALNTPPDQSDKDTFSKTFREEIAVVTVTGGIVTFVENILAGHVIDVGGRI